MKHNDNILSISQNKNEEELFRIYLFLERYINDGSPSGFDLGLPLKFSPFQKEQYIELPIVRDDWTKHLQIGTIFDSLNTSKDEIPFLIHPLVAQKILDFKNLKRRSTESIKVQPTASGRTVVFQDDNNKFLFIKLHFPLKLGRFNRELNLFRWLSTLERSRELFSSLYKFPDILGILYDSGGTFFQNENRILNFGTIFRESIPIPVLKAPCLLIPSFSLFAVKRNQGRRRTILADIIEALKMDEEGFLSLFIYPLIDSYIFLTTKLGMIPEFNAQNVIFELDLTSYKTRVVIRDVGDCFIDFDIRMQQKLHTSFCSYKTLIPSRHNDIFKRRSFAFDFKLSHYIILPLIEEFIRISSLDKNKLISRVKSYVQHRFQDHISYFNSNLWYSYPNEDCVNRDSYIENINPLFR